MLTPVKAIRAKCLDCCGGSMAEVNRCSAGSCALYPFRFGKNPNRAGLGSIANLSRKNPTQPSAFQENTTAEGKDTTPDISAGTA